MLHTIYYILRIELYLLYLLFFLWIKLEPLNGLMAAMHFIQIIIEFEISFQTWKKSTVKSFFCRSLALPPFFKHYGCFFFKL